MDVILADVQRRFKAVDFPTALPGCCYTCRTHEGPFIDTDIQEDMYGAVYLCLQCLTEMAAEFGFTSPEVSDLLKQQIKLHEKKLLETGVMIAELKEENRGLKLAIAHNTSGYDAGDVGQPVHDNEDDSSESGSSKKPKSKDIKLL